MGDTPHLIGMHLSGRKLQAALVDSSGNLVKKVGAEISPENIVSQAASVVRELSSDGANISALGFAIPGLVNRQTDVVLVSPEVPSPIREGLHSELSKATGLRVELENDANAAAYGEFIVGAGRGSRNIFYMMIGNGIGGAIILDGKLWTGSSGFAGEVGHITIDAEGLECVCGNTGCLETLASAPSIVRRAQDRLNRDSTSSLSKLGLNKNFTADDVAHEANEGDDFALMMIERTGKYIGTGVASVINLLNIETIVIGGPTMQAGNVLLNAIVRSARELSFAPSFESTLILAGELGDSAAACDPVFAALAANGTVTENEAWARLRVLAASGNVREAWWRPTTCHRSLNTGEPDDPGSQRARHPRSSTPPTRRPREAT